MAELRWGRAVCIFCVAYVAVTVLAIGLSVGIGVIGHMPATAEPMQNQAYLLSERFLPGMNLVMWGIFAGIYFRGRGDLGETRRREAFSLGGFWVAAAVVVDYVGFVLVPNPLSLSPHDFYVGQAPWIYLIYVAIFLGPVCWVALPGFGRAPAKA